MAFCNTLKFFILLFLVPLLETKERPLSVREILEEISKSLPSFQTANVESTSITTENHEKENFATVLAFDDRDEDIPRIPDSGYSDDGRAGQKNKAQNINNKSGSTSVPNLNDLGNFDSIEVNYPSDVLFSDKSMSTDIDSLTTISDFQYKNSSLSHIDQYRNVSMSDNTQAEMDIEEEKAIDTQINAIFTTNSLRNFEVTENAANNTKLFTPSSQNDFDSEVIEIPVEEVQEEKVILNRHIRSTARLEGNIIVTELDNFNGTFPINFEQIKQSSHNFLSVEPTLLATENTISEKESLLETQSPVLPTLEFDNDTEHHKNRKIVLEPGENVEISVVFTKPSEDDKIVSVLPTPFNKSVTDDLSTTERYFSQTPTVSSKRKTKANVFDTPLNLADSMENSDMSVSSHEVLLKTSSKIKESFVITAKNNMIFFKEKRFDPAHRHRKYFHNTNNRIYRKTLNLKKNNHLGVNKTETNEPVKMTGLNGEQVVNTNDRIYRKTLNVKENNLNATEAPLNRSREMEFLNTRGAVGNNRLECINCSRKDANASCANCTTTTTSTSDFYFNDSPDGGGFVIRNQRHAQIEDFGGTFTGAGGKKKINLFEELKQKINAEKQLEANMSAHGEHKTVAMLNYFVSDALQQPEQSPGPHAHAPVDPGPPTPVRAGVYCAFEKPCDWTWATSFRIVTAADLNSVNVGPKFDASNDTKGHFLFLQVGAGQTFHIASPTLAPSGDACRLELSLHQGNMNASTIKVVGAVGETQWVVSEIFGNSHKSWQRYKFKIGRVSQEFRLIIELIPHLTPAHVALDELRMVDCYPEPARQNRCAVPSQFRCAISNVCINATQVCDIAVDCAHAEDELQDCDKMPFGARCDFEDDWCGWQNDHTRLIQWTRHYVPTVPQTNHSGPSTDHTFLNKSGHYLIVNMAQSVEKKVAFASAAVLYSVVFNPPPPLHSNENSKYYNSCTIRFYYNHNGFHKSGLALMITELKPKENVTTEIWWSFSENKDKWIRGVVTLPNITHRYFLQFTAKKGLRYMSTIAIDDVSLSPECFGLNMPVSELAGYNYWNPQQFVDPTFKETHKGFINKTYYEFTTCGATGRFGPTQHNCTEAYNNTPVDVEVLQKSAFRGIQKWTVPGDGYYTLIAKGASGGRGSGGMGSSRGAVVRTILELRKGEKLYILVGQEGMSACVKLLGKISNESCQAIDDTRNLTGVRAVLNMMIRDGGGGGGGATYVFLVQRKNNMSVLVPLLVAAGGGGIGLGRFTDSPQQHGQAVNMSKTPYNGFTKGGDQSAGAGGGWKTDSHRMLTSESGRSLADGGAGGEACYKSRRGEGSGGFGGGGGGCIMGGAGGGYAGGNAHHSNTTNGDGGTSFYTSTGAVSMYGAAWGALHTGSGALLIIPEASGCGCDYRCLALDEHRARVTCICPPDWFLGANNETCMLREVPNSHGFLIGTLIVIIIIFIIALGALFFMLYNRYQHNKTAILRRKMMSGPELQLNRLRMQSDSIMTEYNPNYEFGGVIYTLKDLQDIPRDQLRLVKALGQGAFGEVYQGFYKARQSDAVEMPVAVKTLPEMSTQQAEMDFLMEALIMSKFNHPNIVHFIGVCFDKHPRFIVLELLAGGDLKNFLRESRPKPERSSPLTMKDLILIAIDVGKGCKYMEDNRFIHRDIAARNCLLTTKGPGRVVKIADFGMSRDIYRSDYYRKGGKAMLPIKWMPPEAFLDGLFTSKTDVWSFGVLLWEIMSMGYMPYTGCANRQVMSLVTSGGRLEPPFSCPGPIYGIMTQCWHPNSEQRPSFAQLLERLGYCLQDPDVVNNPLPVFTKAPSAERDATVMRPKNTDDSCLQVPQNADYLVPTPSAGCDLLVAPHDGSVEKLLSDNGSADSWETSFMLPQSKSTQPLLENNVVDNTNLQEPEVQNLINMDTPQLTPTSTQASDTSLLNHMSYNHNNNVKPLTTTTTNSNLKSGVSLDASILLQQGKRKKPYANVVTTSETGFANGPYAIDNGATDGFKKPAAGYLNNDSEINC